MLLILPRKLTVTLLPSMPDALLTLTSSGSASGSFQVPSGTQSLSVTLTPAAGAGSCFLRLVGHSSGKLLGMAMGSGNQPRSMVAPVDSTVDTQVDWRLTVASGTTNAIVTPLATVAPAPLVPGAPAGGIVFPLHPNNPAAIVSATPYIVWTLAHDATNPLALLLFGWSLTFDGESGASCFASIVGTNAAIFQGPSTNGAELWNRQLLTSASAFTGPRNSEATWRQPLVLAASDPTTQDLALEFQAPIAGTQYNVRGTINAGVVPWIPGLGVPIA